MRDSLTQSIEGWFADHSDGEFVVGLRASPYFVVGPSIQSERIIFTTKPMIVSTAVYDLKMSEDIGMIGRYGLPSRADLNWIGPMVAPCQLLFLGDMDHVDLLVFAWLRAGLHPKPITYAGVSDTLFQGAVPSQSIPCAPSEQRSLPFLQEAVPDLVGVTGYMCARMLKQGRKIEIEGIGNSSERAAMIARLLSSS